MSWGSSDAMPSPTRHSHTDTVLRVKERQTHKKKNKRRKAKTKGKTRKKVTVGKPPPPTTTINFNPPGTTQRSTRHKEIKGFSYEIWQRRKGRKEKGGTRVSKWSGLDWAVQIVDIRLRTSTQQS